jgi:hypothetical protein
MGSKNWVGNKAVVTLSSYPNITLHLPLFSSFFTPNTNCYSLLHTFEDTGSKFFIDGLDTNQEMFVTLYIDPSYRGILLYPQFVVGGLGVDTLLFETSPVSPWFSPYP